MTVRGERGALLLVTRDETFRCLINVVLEGRGIRSVNAYSRCSVAQAVLRRGVRAALIDARLLAAAAMRRGGAGILSIVPEKIPLLVANGGRIDAALRRLIMERGGLIFEGADIGMLVRVIEDMVARIGASSTESGAAGSSPPDRAELESSC